MTNTTELAVADKSQSFLQLFDENTDMVRLVLEQAPNHYAFSGHAYTFKIEEGKDLIQATSKKEVMIPFEAIIRLFKDKFKGGDFLTIQITKKGHRLDFALHSYKKVLVDHAIYSERI